MNKYITIKDYKTFSVKNIYDEKINIYFNKYF